MSTRFNLKTRDWIGQPDKKRVFNDALFTEVAPQYALVTRGMSLGRDQSWKESLVDHLPNLRSPRCLDLGCGSGDISFAIARRYPGGRIIGLDICEAMLELARQQNTLSNVEFQQADMCRTGLTSNSFDLVTGAYALRNAPTLDGVLAEIYRVLRPGGSAAFLDFSRPPQRALQILQHAILVTWGSIWGLALHRRSEVYAYIARSLQQYPQRDQLHELIRANGFINVRGRLFCLGTLEITEFEKPAALKSEMSTE